MIILSCQKGLKCIAFHTRDRIMWLCAH
uniref:Uncharacterized protein n=1 Tax=Anguilla anguilla TaxID=7936 RepID=A0A0E9QR05_ANGAN